MNDATADDDATRQALQALTKETAQLDGIEQADTTVASLTAATEPLSESLHQITASHHQQNASSRRSARTSAPASWTGVRR
ncbi:hypothetical protein BHE97_06460 [Aeromicrobium sp. PE09-221]|uniref:hypothetical protein n=1 Tax=Aeromicrobium sp. PE09-221 TaxID=1898043 RepID=UPI000B3EB9D6|nr:hypothetical protein [Aeromicrobium sp. PE09-221]OUZ11066.1 hypothetical protein BHE97_06460 [Aeromicrobium sp. PE09-221]